MPEPETRELASSICQELGPGWVLAADRHHNAGRWEFHRHGVELRIQFGPERAEVDAIHERVGDKGPWEFDIQAPTIGFSMRKSARQMAAEIRRRLLPAAHADSAKLAAERADRKRRLTARLVTLQRARNLLDGDLHWVEENLYGHPADFKSASSSYRDGQTPHVAIELRDYKGSEYMDEVKVSNLTHPQVLVIVEAAARLCGAGPGDSVRVTRTYSPSGDGGERVQSTDVV